MTIDTTTAVLKQPPVRIAALAYLGTIVFGLFAEVGTRSGLDRTDPQALAASLKAGEAMFRLGVVSDLAMLVCYLIVTAIFYAAFRPYSRTLSLTAAAFSLTGITVLAMGLVNLIAPLMVLNSATGLTDQADLAALFLMLHGRGYTISLVFFGVYCLIIGWMVVRSRLVPAAIGLVMAFAGACYLLNSLRVLLDLPLPGGLADYLLLPGLIGEGAISLWLLARGLNASAWARLNARP
ncbi:MAG TPA: DUF4386 domain-containing protein [Brevundimonas sp.]|uniref:DUF4386 domain-containing protein n=1 Tax=Brevundimonas sp. TaxID=1871086 RepID=UPI00262F3636|nr:DUF4386 domain-containing protein [Brevundimonas sp.]HRO31798.1 DUF4386 domain-containing protein [Brevundimonas sp.]